MLSLRNPPNRATCDASGERWIGPAPWIVTPPPGPRALQMASRDRHALASTFTRHYPLVVQRAQGSIVEDVDGNRYLDFTSGATGCNVGHCHPHVAGAVEAQSRQSIHPFSHGYREAPAIALAEKLAALSPGDDPKRVLLTHGAAEAREAASKLARRFTGRDGIVTLGEENLTREGGDIFASATPPEQVAAVLVELRLLDDDADSAEKLHELRRVCEAHGILLIIDETSIGMGRTGKLFACEHEGVVPDLLLPADGLGSGMPLGAVIGRQDVMNSAADADDFDVGGNPVCCAAALAALELLEKQYLENAVRLGPVALNKLERICDKYRCVNGERGRGLLLTVDVVRETDTGEPDGAMRDRILDEAFTRGLLLTGHGEAGLKFIPPLCINRVQLEVGLDVFDEVVATVSSDESF